jgi:HD-GYP domain-containing protein (c-di-GMP phosphodiesterase class II)
VSIWDKQSGLSAGERERIWLHTYYTERILARSSVLAPIGQLASQHHERLDGSGYHRQVRAPLLPALGQILAAAEIYRGMIEPRPYRMGCLAADVVRQLHTLVREGRLDRAIVAAVLDAAGHPARAAKLKRPAQLSAREVEVLRLLAQGMTNRQIADTLVVAPATVDHHLRHIYDKIGCSTRLAATMFALEQRLV